MGEIAGLLSNYGVGTVIICMFVYDWLTNKKDIKKTLEQNNAFLTEISKSTLNTAKSLDLLQQTMNDEKEALSIHDRRCEDIQRVVKETKEILEKERRNK